MINTETPISEIDFGIDNARIQGRISRPWKLGEFARQIDNVAAWAGNHHISDRHYVADFHTASNVIMPLYRNAILVECEILKHLKVEARKLAEIELRESVEAEIRQEMMTEKQESDREFYDRGMRMIENLKFSIYGDCVTISHNESGGYRRTYIARYDIQDILDISDLDVATSKQEVKYFKKSRDSLANCLKKLEGAIAAYIPRKGVVKPKYRVKAICVPMAQTA